jgi:hypothetical protein
MVEHLMLPLRSLDGCCVSGLQKRGKLRNGRTATAHIHGRPSRAKRASSKSASEVENAVIHPTCC